MLQAAQSGALKLACILLEYGADPRALNNTAFLEKNIKALTISRSHFFMGKHRADVENYITPSLIPHIKIEGVRKLIVDYTAPLDTSILSTAIQEPTKTAPSKTA